MNEMEKLCKQNKNEERRGEIRRDPTAPSSGCVAELVDPLKPFPSLSGIAKKNPYSRMDED